MMLGFMTVIKNDLHIQFPLSKTPPITRNIFPKVQINREDPIPIGIFCMNLYVHHFYLLRFVSNLPNLSTVSSALVTEDGLIVFGFPTAVVLV